MVTNPIILEFIIGYLLAYNLKIIVLFLQKISIKLMLLLGISSLIPVLLELKTIFWIEDAHISTMLIPAVIIFLCIIRLMFIEGWHLPNFMNFTAKISYSIYLLHMAVMFVVIYLSKFFLGVNIFDSFSARFNLLIIVIITTWIVSFIFYFIVEKRLSNIFKRVALSCFKD